MRIAIVSSPRSGNSFVRHVLVDALGIPDLTAHNYINLSNFPAKCVFQIHWYREPNFQRFLSENNFRTLTIARHPLDVLVSALNFITNDSSPFQWLEGNAEIPPELKGNSPASDAFLEYALSWGAENLLSITYQWWHDPNVIKVKYEHIVESPHRQFYKILNALGADTNRLDEAITHNPLERLQNTPNRHGWKATPNLWRKLIPYKHARQIYKRHSKVFDKLGYRVVPNLLSASYANSFWNQIKHQ